MATTRREPFSLTITGSAEIPHLAERGRLNIVVSSTGLNKASVSDDVVTTTKHIETLLGQYCPADSTSEAKAAAALAHWHKTSLATTSFVPYQDPAKDLPAPARRHTATICFDVRFKAHLGDAALGAFSVRLSELPHVEMKIDWMLLAATERSLRARLRRAAAEDALAKAQAYCDVFGCNNLRPVKMQEGQARWGGAMSGGMMYMHGGGGQGGNVPVSYQQMQTSPKSVVQAVQASELSGEREADGSLRFTPKELRMNMDLTVDFHAEAVTPIKRVRADDEEMVDH